MFSAARHRSSGSGRAVPSRARFRRGSALVCGAAAVAAAAGCSGLTSGNGELTDDINVTSTLLQEGRMLPDTFTCHGEAEEGVSPPLQWSGQPDDVGSFAIVADDPGSAEVFWVVYGLDPATVEIRQGGLPQSARAGLNSSGEADYAAPCPEQDEHYDYRFTVYALDAMPELAAGAPLEESLEVISQHTIARGSLTTTHE